VLAIYLSSRMVCPKNLHDSVLMIALRFSFDMDPFVVISFGKKVFRTRVIRHQLNPVWDEKLVFHVRRNENAFTIQFAVLDWDKVGYFFSGMDR
jgi:hypothetical protein